MWKWSFDDLDEVSVGRMKRMFKLWDITLGVRSDQPRAGLRFSGLGSEADVFAAYDAQVAAKRDRVAPSRLAHTLATAVAGHRPCRVVHETDAQRTSAMCSRSRQDRTDGI